MLEVWLQRDSWMLILTGSMGHRALPNNDKLHEGPISLQSNIHRRRQTMRGPEAMTETPFTTLLT
jgi:hypothetical protein